MKNMQLAIMMAPVINWINKAQQAKSQQYENFTKIKSWCLLQYLLAVYRHKAKPLGIFINDVIICSEWVILKIAEQKGIMMSGGIWHICWDSNYQFWVTFIIQLVCQSCNLIVQSSGDWLCTHPPLIDVPKIAKLTPNSQIMLTFSVYF